MTVSIYAIISTAYKYGIKSLKKARRHGEEKPHKRGVIRRGKAPDVLVKPDNMESEFGVPVVHGEPDGDRSASRFPYAREMSGFGYSSASAYGM